MAKKKAVKKAATKKKTTKKTVDKAETSYRQGKKLTAQQAAFVREYCTCWQGKKAAIAAGYSEKTAAEQACQLLNNAKVQQAIENEIQKAEELVKLRRVQLIENMEAIANFRLSDIVFVNERGGLSYLPTDQWPEEAKIAITEMGETISQFGGSTKIKSESKIKAIETLMRYNKMLTDKVELSGSVSVDATYERLKSMPPDKRQERLEELRKQREQIEKSKNSVKLKE